MAGMRELTLNEKRTLICALAADRTAAYLRAVELRNRSADMEDNGQSGYLALDNEADLYETLADTTDRLIDLICEGRLVIKERNETDCE